MKISKMTILTKVLESNSSNSIQQMSHSEEYFITRILDEELWIEKSIEEQQNRRTLSLNIDKKINELSNYKYKENYIHSVASLEAILDFFRKKYAEVEYIDDFIALKFIALLVIEKDFLAEAMFAQRHLPLDMFEQTYEDISKRFPEVSSRLKDFIFYYKEMYNNWPNRPT